MRDFKIEVDWIVGLFLVSDNGSLFNISNEEERR